MAVLYISPFMVFDGVIFEIPHDTAISQNHVIRLLQATSPLSAVLLDIR